MPNESKDTSLNQISAGLKVLTKIIDFDTISNELFPVNLDYGGGKYEKGTLYLREKGIHNLVFDPYNRTEAHNRAVQDYAKKYKVDTVTLLNVLNVIPDKAERLEIFENILDWAKPMSKVLISIYEKNGDGKAERTSKGYQNNQKTQFYADEIMDEFSKEFSLISVQRNYILLGVK